MSEIKVQEPAEATEPTDADGEALAQQLLGETAENTTQEPEKESVTEPEETKETKEETKTVEVGAAEYLKLKSQAGRVENLNKDKSDLASELKQIRESFTAKTPEETKLNANEVVDKLASDDSEKFLQGMVDKSASAKMAELEADIAEVKKDAAASKYDANLEIIAKKDYVSLRPLMDELVGAVRDGVDAGDPTAIEEAKIIRGSPKYLVMLAREFRESKTSDQSAEARKGRDQERSDARNISGPSKTSAAGSDEPSEQDQRDFLDNVMGL